MPLLSINKELLPMKIHYFVGIAGVAAIFPFLTTVSRQRGYSSSIVGLIFTLAPIPGVILKPVFGVITDKYKCHKLIIVLMEIIKCIIVSVLMFIPDKNVENELKDKDVIMSPLFWLFTCCLILLKTGYFVRTVVDDTICIGLLGQNRHKYGQQRLWGSFGGSTMSLVSGLCIDWYSKGQKYKDYTLGLALSVIFLLLDVYVVSKIKVVQKTENKTTEGSSVKKLFTEVKVLTFIFWVVVFGIFNSFALYFVVLYMEDLANIYHPETKSWIKTLQGLSITMQCAGGDVPFFFLSSFILKRVNHTNVFSLMFFTFSVRFFLYSVIKNPVWVLPVELLNGVTFALTYSAAISFAAHLAPAGAEGTLQGITGMFFEGIGLPIGCFIGGYLFDRFGSITTFKLLSFIALAACVTHIIVNLLINRWAKNEEVINTYREVETKNHSEEEETTTM